MKFIPKMIWVETVHTINNYKQALRGLFIFFSCKDRKVINTLIFYTLPPLVFFTSKTEGYILLPFELTIDIVRIS